MAGNPCRTMAGPILCERPKAARDCNIEPPASPYAIMRRAYLYRRTQ